MLGEVNRRGKRARDRIILEARGRIREKAIKRAKSRIVLANRRVHDFSERELEELVAAEEEKLLKQLWQMPLAAILVALGLS